jgi:hypothetical protein
MTEGCVYVTKQNEKVLYLGRHDFYNWESDWGREDYAHVNKHQKCHVFVKYLEDGKTEYWTQTGFTKLAAKLNEEASSDFAAEYDKFKHSVNGCPNKDFTFKKIKDIKPRLHKAGGYYWKAQWMAFKDGDRWFAVEIYKNDYPEDSKYPFEIDVSSAPIKFGTLENGQAFYTQPHCRRGYRSRGERVEGRLLPNCATEEELCNYDFYDMYVVPEKGRKIKV